MSYQIVTTSWAELIGVSETGLEKNYENRLNVASILIYFGETPPSDDLEAFTIKFPESGRIFPSYSAGKVWVKSVNNLEPVITIDDL